MYSIFVAVFVLAFSTSSFGASLNDFNNEVEAFAPTITAPYVAGVTNELTFRECTSPKSDYDVYFSCRSSGGDPIPCSVGEVPSSIEILDGASLVAAGTCMPSTVEVPNVFDGFKRFAYCEADLKIKDSSKPTKFGVELKKGGITGSGVQVIIYDKSSEQDAKPITKPISCK